MGADCWHGTATLRIHRSGDRTIHQGGATAPLKLQRGFLEPDGRLQLPILHTAGGLVGGDRLSLTVSLEPGSHALLTSAAAQKVYGSIGRSRLAPKGAWARQEVHVNVASHADLEWLPQEVVMFEGALFEQRHWVDLAPGASWLGAEVVRLGRTAAGEGIGQGRWRSSLEIRRRSPREPPGVGGSEGQGAEVGRWELVDRLELGGAGLAGEHGMASQPVFGSLVWAAPASIGHEQMRHLLEGCRADRTGLVGEMACGSLEQGLVARYRGPSTTAARHWFIRIWARLRVQRGGQAPQLPRVWPFQEDPLGRG